MASGLKNQGVSPDSDRSSRSSGAWTDWNVSLVKYAIVALDYYLTYLCGVLLLFVLSCSR